MKILVLGGRGLIGNNLVKYLSKNKDLKVYTTSRNKWNSNEIKLFSSASLIPSINLERNNKILNLLKSIKPDVVINSAGITKHLPNGNEPLSVLPINTLAPHFIAKFCSQIDCKFIQLSTDCVFSGSKGNYFEEDFPDANDLYGKSKYLGEPNTKNSLTIRISTIGHELNTNYGLLNWFLNKSGSCKGYLKNIFSGFTVEELSNIFCEHIFNNLHLKGLYHISSSPISKYELLKIISSVYKHKISIEPDTQIKINRSLNSEKFKYITNYQPPSWPDQIYSMYSLNKSE
mgnify:CR=1 FL=1|tara:strand:- start:188 stop:1051 length:864 start_codon:yes stop_codon:yes gene_type:complete